MKPLLIEDAEVIYLPKNLNLEEKVRLHSIDLLRYPNNRPKALERITVVLGQITARMIHNKDFEQSIDEGYVPLNATVLQDLVEDYRAILDWALEAGIIETDGQYIPDQKATGYRFADWCFKETRKHYIYDEKLIGKMRGRRVDKKSVEKQPFLYQCLQEIEIDYDGAVNEMHQLIEGKTWETKLYSRIAAIEMLHNRQFFFRRDKRVGRLHTNITGLKREARKFLSWRDHQLVNVDIKNSQPYFSLALFKEEAFHKLQIPNLLSYYNPLLTKFYTPTLSPMLGKYGDIFVTYRYGDDMYEEVVTKGKLYEYLGEQLGLERKKVKELVFNIFFSVPSWHFKGKSEFTRLFTDVWKVFEWVNTGFYRTKKQGRKKRDQSNALAMLLQKIESTVILDQVVPRIEREIPGLPMWTIHDSIMTVRGKEENIARMIREEAERVIGVAPTVDFE